MNRPIEIIAEAGVNWQGSIAIAENMITIAKEAGADVIKFQLYDPRKRPDIDTHPYKDILLQTRLTKRKLYHLQEKCVLANIEFMCSVFDIDLVDWTEAVEVKRYKIGSKSFYDIPLIKRIVDTGKPVLLSTGYFNPDKLGMNKKVFDLLSQVNYTLLYCISKYPSALSDVIDLKQRDMLFQDMGGYSSHVPGITDAIMAMSIGARVVEKHFTLDRTQEGPDHSFSLETEELQLLCSMRDDVEKILY